MGFVEGGATWLAEHGFTFSNVVGVLGGLIFLIVTVIIGGLAIYWAYNRKSFNKTIVVFEKVNGIFQETKRDVAAEINIPGRGINVFLLKRLKTNYEKYLPRPTKQTGFRTYWFCIGEDGEWVNVGLEDFDAKRRQLNLSIDSVDMKNQRAAFQKLLRDNYKPKKWYLEYAPYIALGILILLLGVAAWFVADKLVEAIDKSGEYFDTAKEVSQLQKEILGAMDNLKSNTGMRTVG